MLYSLVPSNLGKGTKNLGLDMLHFMPFALAKKGKKAKKYHRFYFFFPILAILHVGCKTPSPSKI